jgi:hypothetical protein
MITKCFNPACQAPFDYRAGRLVRFSSKTNVKSSKEESRPFIEHFWLCGGCSTRYKFECKTGMSVELIRDETAIRREEPAYLVTYA